MTEFEEYIAYWYREMLITRKKIRETEEAKAFINKTYNRFTDTQKQIVDMLIKGE